MCMSNITKNAAIAAIIKELSDKPELIKAFSEILAGTGTGEVVTAPQASGMYVACVEMTYQGRKYQHPIVGNGWSPSRNPEDYKMVAGPDLLKLQQEQAMIINGVKSMGKQVRIINVSDETYAQLQEMLVNLVKDVLAKVEEAVAKIAEANALVGKQLDTDMEVCRMAGEIMRNAMVAGQCITDQGTIETRQDEEYDEEVRQEYDEEYEDEYDDEEYYDEE